MIALNTYTKRVTAKVLNMAVGLNFTYRASHIIGIRVIGGVAQVKVKIGDAVSVLSFDPEQFKQKVVSVKREVIAAIATEARRLITHQPVFTQQLVKARLQVEASTPNLLQTAIAQLNQLNKTGGSK